MSFLNSEKEIIKKLKALRDDIVLNSLYLDDYKNRFELDEKEVCMFFDAYLDYLIELWEDKNKKKFSDYGELEDALELDNIDNLYEFYYMSEMN